MDPFHERLARVGLAAAARYGFCLAYRHDGLEASVEREGPTFARLAVIDPESKATSVIELGVDWRAYPPVQLAIGPVLHPGDEVAALHGQVGPLGGRDRP